MKEDKQTGKYIKRIVEHYWEEKDSLSMVSREGRRARERGCYTKKEFISVCRWKSPRPLNQYIRNSESTVKKNTKIALSPGYEKDKINALVELYGVSIAMASALLTCADHNKYCIIDIRLWQALVSLGIVNNKKHGRSINVGQWVLFLSVMRKWSKKLKVNIRRIERSLFWFHQDYLQGGSGLYDPKRSIKRIDEMKGRRDLLWLFK